MVSGVWAVNFLVLYAVSFSRLSANNVLLSYWNEFFMPMPPWQNLAWFTAVFAKILAMPIDLTVPWLGALLITVGLATYLVKNRRMGIILLTPLIMTLLASGLKKYPFGDRLLLFAVPIFFLFMGTAVEQLRTILAGRHAVGAFVLSLAVAVSLAYGPTAQAIANVRHPHNDEDIKTVLEYVAHRKASRDVLYVYYSAIPAFTYYAPGFGLDTLYGHQRIAIQETFPWLTWTMWRNCEATNGSGLFSHTTYNWGSYDEAAFIYEYLLPKMGTKMDEVRSVDASAFLFDMR